MSFLPLGNNALDLFNAGTLTPETGSGESTPVPIPRNTRVNPANTVPSSGETSPPTALSSPSIVSPNNVVPNNVVPPALRPDLTGRFGQIILPDTVDFGDIGFAQVIVTNRGVGVANGPFRVNLYLSTDNNIDSNDVLVGGQITNFTLGSGQSTTLNFNYQNITSVIAPGAYYLVAEIDSENQVNERLENNNVASQLVSAPGTDLVVDWNAAALNAIQAAGEAGNGVPPTAGSRLLALLSTAVYDTVNAFTQAGQSYAIDTTAPAGASLGAAVVGAAFRILSTSPFLQGQAPSALLSQQLVRSLAEIQDSPLSESQGLAFGQSIANQILALRANDGSNNNAPYVPPAGDYVWIPDPGTTALGPNWGQVTPWAITSVADFAPDGLDGTPTNNPELYAAEIEEVRLLGGRNNTALTPILRTADQTQIAEFWAYDREDTFRPYGQLNQITQEIAVREGNSLFDNARLFAALNTALADAAIVAWDAKYEFVQPRPDDVIAGGFAANDGIESTIADPDWLPLLPTPAFPDYISGHSTFAGAWAGVLTEFFGENYSFSAVSQELPGVVRNFNSFFEAGVEDALSRIYGGVHVREASVTDAVPIGFAIGEFVAQNFFQPAVI